uniref:Fe2OG dioxygenase domain-containing protein n=1 Tax=Aureoumbra lagunensis TaxID=44058 RepID=A0A7S3K389_9STRA|mmetsp:Transcript_3397/g.4745  ORF Transcript_3397/g.4745 Transcript_3397/m.4745 type:complete len:317 (+) Transcript_3397:31-981(+)
MRLVLWPKGFTFAMAASAISSKQSVDPNRSALSLVRRLEAPRALVERGGDVEGVEFWEEYADLLDEARQEFGCKHQRVYTPSFDDCFVPEIVEALENNDVDLRKLVKPTTVNGVYALRLLNDEFIADLIDEFEHLRSSGIPLRRPNGMNRHGCILSHLGFQEGFLNSTLAPVLRKLGLALYPKALRAEDLNGEVYGFSVRYEAISGGDIQLAEHADGSALTFNLCLGGGKSSFDGGHLLFRGVRFHEEDAHLQQQQAIPHEPGVALIHLGQHLHAAATLQSGIRENLVLWLTGKHGYVRIAPYADEESDDMGRVFY